MITRIRIEPEQFDELFPRTADVYPPDDEFDDDGDGDDDQPTRKGSDVSCLMILAAVAALLFGAYMAYRRPAEPEPAAQPAKRSTGERLGWSEFDKARDAETLELVWLEVGDRVRWNGRDGTIRVIAPDGHKAIVAWDSGGSETLNQHFFERLPRAEAEPAK